MKIKKEIYTTSFIIIAALCVSYFIFNSPSHLNAQTSSFYGCYHKSGEANCVDKYFYNGFCFTSDQIETEAANCVSNNGTFDCGCSAKTEKTNGAKVCKVVSSYEGGWVDVLNVSSDFTKLNCENYAKEIEPGDSYRSYYLGCITSDGIHFGPTSGAFPYPDCGWSIGTPKRAFVTRGLYPGDFGTIGSGGGVVRADANCNLEASSVGLSGIYKAWIADKNSSSAPASRFVKSELGYVMPNADGNYIQLSTSWSDTLDGLLSPINRGPDGNLVCNTPLGNENSYAWTNVRKDGTQTSEFRQCSEWLSNDISKRGVSTACISSIMSNSGDNIRSGGGGLEDTGDFACSSRLHLFCFEQ